MQARAELKPGRGEFCLSSSNSSSRIRPKDASSRYSSELQSGQKIYIYVYKTWTPQQLNTRHSFDFKPRNMRLALTFRVKIPRWARSNADWYSVTQLYGSNLLFTLLPLTFTVLQFRAIQTLGYGHPDKGKSVCPPTWWGHKNVA